MQMNKNGGKTSIILQEKFEYKFAIHFIGNDSLF